MDINNLKGNKQFFLTFLKIKKFVKIIFFFFKYDVEIFFQIDDFDRDGFNFCSLCTFVLRESMFLWLNVHFFDLINIYIFHFLNFFT